MMRTILFTSHCLVVVCILSAVPSIGQAQPTPPPPGKFQKWPATPEPPEMLAERKQAEQAAASINQGRLTPQQKRQMLLNHPNPTVRAKAQEALRAKSQPRSSLDLPNPADPLASLSTLLNPFAVSEANAQTPFAVVLTPQSRFHPPTKSTLTLNGTNASGGSPVFSTFHLKHAPPPAITSGLEGTLGTGVHKPYATVFLNIPFDGWYLLDFYGYGKPKAALHIQTVSPLNPTPGQIYYLYPVLETWDMTASPTFLNHFVLAEYLQAGAHTFYFKIEQGGLYFYEAAIEAF